MAEDRKKIMFNFNIIMDMNENLTSIQIKNIEPLFVKKKNSYVNATPQQYFLIKKILSDVLFCPSMVSGTLHSKDND